MTLRAQFDGKALIPVDVDHVDLRPGEIYELEIRKAGLLSGSPRDLLAVIDSQPKMPVEDINAMEREIEQASYPARFKPIFDDDQTG
jgi:hypothetical protein